jgi:DNA-directed RNA polymerase specialized sigma subunit
LFLYRYFSACFTEDTNEALSRALELNAMFKKPLPESEVETDTKSATRAYQNKLYKYTNAKLIEILDIDEKEQRELKSIIGTKEKYRRNNDRRTPKNEKGLTKKQQETEDLKLKILELKKQGNSIREIAEILEISKSKVGRIIKK